jgi:hypothetical protein
MPARRRLLPLADVADRQRRDGFPEPLIRRKHPVIPVPVSSRRRDEIGEPVEKLKRRELDDAIGPRPRGLSAAAGPDPVGGFVPWQHVADASDPAVCTAAHGEPLESKGRAPAWFLAEVARELALPAFAIGGITLERLDDLVALGLRRVAVASAITAAADPAAAAAAFIERLARIPPAVP